MKIIVSVLAVAWLVSGCASLTTAPDDDSVTGANLDARTNLCTDATPPPCEPASGLAYLGVKPPVL
jgi:PBP1b-binding outer membrane lipoprotein LpoB